MNRRFADYSVAALAGFGAILLLFGSQSAAQNATDRAVRARERAAAAAAKPTPRMADGHPDLSGFYAGQAELGDPNEEDGGHVVTKTTDGSVFFSYGGANTGGQAGLDGNPTGEGGPAQAPPPYKPEYMAKHQRIVKTVYGWVSHLDPFHGAGLPACRARALAALSKSFKIQSVWPFCTKTIPARSIELSIPMAANIRRITTHHSRATRSVIGRETSLWWIPSA